MSATSKFFTSILKSSLVSSFALTKNQIQFKMIPYEAHGREQTPTSLKAI